MIYGDYTEYQHENTKLYVYSRQYHGERALVICSFCDKNMIFKAPEGFDMSQAEQGIYTYPDCLPFVGNSTVLRPYEARVYLFKKG